MDNGSLRKRISVPLADTSVVDFINAQRDFSYSMRVIIKDAIAKYGMADVTCVEVRKDGRGRPPKNFESEIEYSSVNDVVEPDTEVKDIITSKPNITTTTNSQGQNNILKGLM